MAKKVISFSLNAASIDRAIKELDDYIDDFQQKCNTLREKIAERIAWSASTGFRAAISGDIVGRVENGKLVKAEPLQSNVQVSVTHDGNISVVFAEGEEAVFIEYGAGVYNNGAAGSSPHPWGPENGYLIGTYGKGHGRKKTWGYQNENGEIILTHGTPAAMPMYRGMREAINAIDGLIREVFG